MVQPAEPFGRDAARIIRSGIDHPAADDAVGIGAALIIDIAEPVLADARLAAQAEPGCRRVAPFHQVKMFANMPMLRRLAAGRGSGNSSCGAG